MYKHEIRKAYENSKNLFWATRKWSNTYKYKASNTCYWYRLLKGIPESNSYSVRLK